MNENKSYNKSNKIPIEEYAESKLIKSEILKKSKSGVIFYLIIRFYIDLQRMKTNSLLLQKMYF